MDGLQNNRILLAVSRIVLFAGLTRTNRLAGVTRFLLVAVTSLATCASLIGCQSHDNIAAPADRFNMADRISSQQVTAFAEDSRGYIWIGTQRGLNRYNGASYCQYFSQGDSTGLADNVVNAVMADNADNLWVATTKGLNCMHFGRSMSRVSDDFISMLADTPGEYFIFGNIVHVWRVSKRTMQVDLIHTFGALSYANQFMVDQVGNLWTIEGNTVLCHDLDTEQVVAQLSITGHSVFAIPLAGSIYIATDQGFQAINTITHELCPPSQTARLSTALSQERVAKMLAFGPNAFLIYTQSRRLFLYTATTGQLLSSSHPDFPFDAPSAELSTVFIDSHRNVWMGTRRQGYQVAYSRQNPFNRNIRMTAPLQGRTISALRTGLAHVLWIIVDNHELYRFSADEGLRLIHCPSDLETIDDVWADHSGNLWLASGPAVFCGRVSGLEYHVAASYPLMPVTGAADAQGNVFVSSVDGIIYQKSPSASSFLPLTDPGHHQDVCKLLNLPDGRMAMLSQSRGLVWLDSHTNQMLTADLVPTRGHTFKYADIAVDSHGRLWLATLGAGVLCHDPASGNTRWFDSDEYCHDACCVVADEMGYIWIGTYEGLTRLDPSSGRMTTYHQTDGISDDEFSMRCAVSTPGRNIILGGMHGLTSIAISDLLPPSAPVCMMEYLTLDNEIVQDLAINPEVSLPYDNQGIDFSYTTLHYGSAAPVLRYRMEGFDPAWSVQRDEEHLYYSHLPAGRYTLRLSLASGSGTDVEQTVRVVVRPAPWATPVMRWLVYPLLGLLVVSAVIGLLYRRSRSLRRLRQAEEEGEKERRANELNMRFFSNISHEFRTPLTLIHGALSIQPVTDHLLSIARSNAQRLLKLVNQMMDFNKMENGMLQLCVTEVDVVPIVRQIVGWFEAQAQRKGMTITLNLPASPFMAWVDTDKLEKVMVNLIANALKYAGNGQNISISLGAGQGEEKGGPQPEDGERGISDDGQAVPRPTIGRRWMQVSVADTGVGIPEDQREAVFGRFYQVESHHRLPAIGTGIGLYYVRSLIEFHHGRIRCLPNEPQGSVFTFTLPIDADSYTPEQRQAADPLLTEDATRNLDLVPDFASPADEAGDGALPIVEPESSAAATEEHLQTAKPTLMVVDDDSDVLALLNLILSPHYLLSTHTEAKDAYAQLEKVRPDLILSDVMMAEVDGYQFCQMVRSDRAVCHIPVVLLTARSALSEQVHGLDCGASAYVTKPFSPDYLLAVIRSQLEQVRRLQASLNSQTQLQPAEEGVLQQADSEFMQAFYAYIGDHLTDAELQIDELTALLGMSRSRFFFKVKALTGEAPNAFFKTFKLNRAAEMLVNADDKLAYIAYATGFSSPSHFSANFKKRFGCSPSEYKAEHTPS